MTEAITQRCRFYFSALQDKLGEINAQSAWFNWKNLKRVLTLSFFALVAYLLYSKSGDIEWGQVKDTFFSTPKSTLVLGVFLGVLCYLAYSCYDLFGRYLFNIKTRWWHVVWVGYISYACNLNLGAIIGSLAFRFRLYSRLNVKASDVSRIIGVTVLSNWIGYACILSVLVLMGSLSIPESWYIDIVLLKVLAVLVLIAMIAYLLMCKRKAHQEISIRNSTFTVPSPAIALLQLGLAVIHWSLMATVVYLFMPDTVSYGEVYAVLLISGLAGAVSHIPGGLGVLEATFIALLSGQAERPEIIAALFAYRCVFYLIPFAMALPSYALFEWVMKGQHAESE
ncbi:Inner membrane protein YbhN [Thalassocella blandensis]|nr:Inner membrane protein YbhN [Thalassocella blandensis]